MMATLRMLSLVTLLVPRSSDDFPRIGRIDKHTTRIVFLRGVEHQPGEQGSPEAFVTATCRAP